MKHKYFWEDFPVGSARHVGTRTVTAQEIYEFAKQFDPQDFHIDAERARNSPFGELIASGWHLCALVMRMICDDFLLETAASASPGADNIRWKAPVRAGDTLSVQSTVIEARRSKQRPEMGIIRWRFDVRNQLGEEVAQMVTVGMVRCRTSPALNSVVDAAIDLEACLTAPSA